MHLLKRLICTLVKQSKSLLLIGKNKNIGIHVNCRGTHKKKCYIIIMLYYIIIHVMLYIIV